MAKYRVLMGIHHEQEVPPRRRTDGVLAYRIYKAGETFESPIKNLCDVHQNKLEPVVEGGFYGNIGGIALPPQGLIFDPAGKETIEQFAERARAAQQANNPQQPASPTQTPQAVVPIPDKPLEQWTVEELKKYAEAEEIDLRRCGNDKAKILTEIKKAQTASVG